MLTFEKPSLDLGHSQILPSKVVKNLGVLFDENLNMQSHIDQLCKNLFFIIRSINLYRDFLTTEVTIKLMVSLVLSKLDYCNALLTGLPDFYIDKLQRIQNCAAKVIFKKKKFDHVTPLLYDLHWLPVRERINFKVATFCFKVFENSAPSYISSLLKKQTSARQLRSSSDKSLLKVPLPKSKSYGKRSFTFLLQNYGIHSPVI